MDAYDWMYDDEPHTISMRHEGSGPPGHLPNGESRILAPGGGLEWSDNPSRPVLASEVNSRNIRPAGPFHTQAGPSRPHNGYRNIGTRTQPPFQPQFLPPEEDEESNDWHPVPQQMMMDSSSIGPTHVGAGSNLRPVSDLPAAFRRCYRFENFNAVQSRCFDTIYNTDENVVIGAPTGSGKTILFELAMIRLFLQNQQGRVVYMAPTKSLCHERAQDWKSKFAHLGIVCTELTGDTSDTSGYASLKKSHVIVTTPEKWDSMTRRWHEQEHLLSQLRLFCMDEVHILNEDRGAVLEVVVSRMKTLGHVVRFIAVSATVPNIEDVASWLGPNSNSRLTAVTHSFDDSFRPVQLERHVYGYASKGTNDFSFAITLNSKIMELVKKHASGKPVLVFCSTRKACVQAAQALAKDYAQLQKNRCPPWKVPQTEKLSGFQDKTLQALVTSGIAFHHAGLSSSDRQNVETAFVKGNLHVICTTSTLAVGVNLPARMVIIRGTQQWDPARGGSAPYSDLDLMQMMGRAGRPQFDRTGVAVIMTEQDNVAKYKRLARSETTLESCLHKNLIEHINSEIALRTIVSVETALNWLRSTFLYVRASLNATFYGVDDESPDRRLEELVREAITMLAGDGIIMDKTGQGSSLACTARGDIMSRFYVSHPTFVSFCNLKPNASVRDILSLIAGAKEFEQLRVRQGEKQPLLVISKNPEIRFQICKIASVADKVMILAQVVLGAISLADLKQEHADAQNFGLHAALFFKDAPRLLRGLIDVLLESRDAGSLCSALTLFRSVSSRAWDGSAHVLRQLEGIGEKSVQILADKQIWSFEQLIATDPRRIDQMLNRQVGFGSKLINEAKAMPRMSIEVINWRTKKLIDGIECSCDVTIGLHNNGKINVLPFASVTVFCVTLDNQWIDFRRIKLNKIVQCPKTFSMSTKLDKPSQKIVILAAVDVVAGSEARLELTIASGKGSSSHPLRIPATSYLPQEQLYEAGASDEGLHKDVAPSEFPAPTTTKKRPAPKADSTHSVERDIIRLPNGNYKCAHTCKKECRHLCCREGLEKPPAAKRLKMELPAPPEPSIVSLHASHPERAHTRVNVPSYSATLSNFDGHDRVKPVEMLKINSKSAHLTRVSTKPGGLPPTIGSYETDDLPDPRKLFEDGSSGDAMLADPKTASTPPPRHRFLPTSESTPEAPSLVPHKKQSTMLSAPLDAPPRARSPSVPAESSFAPQSAVGVDNEDDEFMAFLNEHTA